MIRKSIVKAFDPLYESPMKGSLSPASYEVDVFDKLSNRSLFTETPNIIQSPNSTDIVRIVIEDIINEAVDKIGLCCGYSVGANTDIIDIDCCEADFFVTNEYNRTEENYTATNSAEDKSIEENSETSKKLINVCDITVIKDEEAGTGRMEMLEIDLLEEFMQETNHHKGGKSSQEVKEPLQEINQLTNEDHDEVTSNLEANVKNEISTDILKNLSETEPSDTKLDQNNSIGDIVKGLSDLSLSSGKGSNLCENCNCSKSFNEIVINKDQELATINEELVKKNEELERLRSDYEKQNEQLALRSSEYQRLQEHFERIEKENVEIRSKYEEAIRLTIESQSDNKDNECIKALKKEFALKEMEFERLMNDYSRLIETQVEKYRASNEECNLVKKHLTNLEVAFSDVHEKYERSKTIIDGYKLNEENLRSTITICQNTLKKFEEQYESMQRKYHEENVGLKNELKALKEEYTSKLNVQISKMKRLEIKVASLTNSLEQKSKECEELTKLWEEVTPRF